MERNIARDAILTGMNRLLLWLGIVSLGGALPLTAQEDVPSRPTTFLLQAKLHTRGLGGGFEVFWRKRYSHNLTTGFFVSSFKDLRQIKISNQFVDRRTQPYVYGKLHHVVLLGLTGGRRQVIARRNDPMAIEVAAVFQGGVLGAVLIPTYLEIVHYDPVTQAISFSVERYDPLVHVDQRYIAGGVPWTYGLRKASWMPGLYGQAAMAFGLPSYWSAQFSLRMGVDLMAFPAPLPLMAYIKNEQIFAVLFLSVLVYDF